MMRHGCTVAQQEEACKFHKEQGTPIRLNIRYSYTKKETLERRVDLLDASLGRCTDISFEKPASCAVVSQEFTAEGSITNKQDGRSRTIKDSQRNECNAVAKATEGAICLFSGDDPQVLDKLTVR